MGLLTRTKEPGKIPISGHGLANIFIQIEGSERAGVGWRRVEVEGQ